MYRSPMLTEVAAFKKDTNGAGSTIFVIHPRGNFIPRLTEVYLFVS